jgi:uncharacterized surface protein with fasciclin (FAS1) repeats
MTTRNLSLAAAVAAMLAFAPMVARADDTSTTTTSTTTTTTQFVPIDIVTINPPPMGPNGEPIDYSILATRNFDYVDLNQARAEGFSHHDIAVMAKISDKAGVPFEEVKQLALDGMAYPTIAAKFGLSPTAVWKVDEYERRIAMYRVAYENTGDNAVRNLVAASQEEYIAPSTTAYTTTTQTTTTSSPGSNLADYVNNAPELTMFARALRQAHLMKVLNGGGQFTIFAPTDSAFAKLSTDQLNALMNNRDELIKVLDYHIIPQRIDAAQALAMSSPTSPATLEGDPLQVTNTSGNVYVNGASVVKADVITSNGILHEVDTVLMPPSLSVINNTTTTTSPSTTISPNSTTTVEPNGTTTTTTPNGTTTVEPNGTTTVQPAPTP